MDDSPAASPPERSDTETGFGTGLRAQLARSRDLREHDDDPDVDLEPYEPADVEPEAARPPSPKEPGGGETDLDGVLDRDNDLLRSLSARHAKLAEWIEARGRQVKSPQAAALLASSTSEARLERDREDGARLEALEVELAGREAAVKDAEADLQAKAERVEQRAAEAAQNLQEALARTSEQEARELRLNGRESDLAARERTVADAVAAVEKREAEARRVRGENDARAHELGAEAAGLAQRERELADRQERLDATATLDETRAELERKEERLTGVEQKLAQQVSAVDERESELNAKAQAAAAELADRERRLQRQEEAIAELKEWLVNKEHELAAYLGDSGESGR